MQKTKRLALLSIILLASVGLAFAAQASGVLVGLAGNVEDAEINIQTATVSLILTPEDKAKATDIVLMDSQVQELLDGADNYTLLVSEVFDIHEISFDVHETGGGVALVPKEGIAKVTVEINNDYGDEFGVQVIEVTVDLVKEEIVTKDVQPEIVKPKVNEGIVALSELVENPSNYVDVVVTVSGNVSLLGEVFGSLFDLDGTVTVFYAHEEATVGVSNIQNGDTVTVTGRFAAPNTIYARASRNNKDGENNNETTHNSPNSFPYSSGWINLKTNPKIAIMATLFAVSAFTLAGKLLMPTPIQIVIQGEEPIIVGQIFRYTQFDVVLISASTVVLALSSFYLLFVKSNETSLITVATAEKDTSNWS